MNEAKLIKLQTNRLISGMEQLALPTENAPIIMAYLLLLQKWNKAYNMTSIDELGQMVTHHALDALAVANHYQGQRIIDVGTGGGIPGFILAIMFPEKHLVLLDAVGKKARFMRQVKRELGLVNTEIVHQRVENYFPEEKFDVVTSRAFSELNQFLQVTAHLGGIKCQYLAMKGPKTETLKSGLPFKQTALWEIKVPFLDVERKLYQFEKTHEN
ncbi:16S rRNA (guanine(527)-N(7))-methyltransferase RsmG [Marinicella litoralis]|uniref:Ribosomal RNA small subunit methyltransferase G n=1 Tax=Marinicella litoralis TaxID=644220 RepID=A0A4R6XT57_9GAMM|nr:16S rRNA (guanine(527)-N(7))-methyltransferase RsmG [Marinicella litoralis]TDR20613.1 16S rRNA m(7)G-527 methyltransferase [Marinicella litoralis]